MRKASVSSAFALIFTGATQRTKVDLMMIVLHIESDRGDSLEPSPPSLNGCFLRQTGGNPPNVLPPILRVGYGSLESFGPLGYGLPTSVPYSGAAAAQV